MVFAYYNSLSKGDKATYRKSDRITTLALPNNRQHSALVSSLRAALQDEDCKAAADACQQLARCITRGLSIPPVVVRVLARTAPHTSVVPSKAARKRLFPICRWR